MKTPEVLTYGSVCSGIEAASVAWEPLGLSPEWFSEIEQFPSTILAHHWPEVPNVGDMTRLAARVRAGELPAPSILVGGTPCQAFSVAGARKGMADDRGQLTISYGELADAIDEQRSAAGRPPVITVWENVPGVLSSKDNAFGAFLGLLSGEECELEPPGKKWTNAGYVSGPKRAIAWRVLDAKYFGLSQQRSRIFVVSSARTDCDPGKILFEPARSSWPSPEAAIRSSRCTIAADGSTLFRFKRTDSYACDGLSSTLSARDYKDRRDLVVAGDGRVRGLMPSEYERLQGFPVNHTLVPYTVKLVEDAQRYKALGNSMPVPVMRWIGDRIISHLRSVAI